MLLMERQVGTGKPVKATTLPLFIGPWIGEFGHELMFAGMARHAAVGRQHVIACSRPTSAAVYRDFVDEFVPHDIDCEGMITTATHGTHMPPALLMRYVPPGIERFVPREYHGSKDVLWHLYGRRRGGYAGAVVVHARYRPHVAARNWSQRNWNRLARRIFREGLAKRVICIGLRKHAMTAEGAVDMRDAPLEVQMDVLASAEFAIGPSSGPMHLASLCGCPHLVWCGGAATEWRRTCKRYKSEWNPFGTLAHAHPCASWQPHLETVWGWLGALLDEIATGK